MERIDGLKVKYDGKMYDVRSINFSTGNVIMCSEGHELKEGFHKNLEADELELYVELKSKQDE